MGLTLSTRSPTPPLFNASLHVYWSGCSWGCRPGPYLEARRTPRIADAPHAGLYRTAKDNTTCPPCVDLYPDGGLLRARVRQYSATTPRPPSWLSKCCGHDGVTLPGPFPRRS